MTLREVERCYSAVAQPGFLKGGGGGDGGLMAEPSSRGRQGGLGSGPPALGDFCNFSIKITHFMHISAKIVIL